MADQLLNQEQLAKRLNMSQASVSRWLSGSKPHRQRAVALARTLNVSVEWLLDGLGRYDQFNSYITPITQFQSADAKFGNREEIKKGLNEAKAKFPSRLRWLREQLGISLSTFGRHCGYGGSYISRLENSSRANPSLKFLQALRDSYGISRHWLRTGADFPYDPPLDFAPPPDLAEALKKLNTASDATRFTVMATLNAQTMSAGELHGWLGGVLSHPEISAEAKREMGKILSNILAKKLAKD